MIVNVPDCPSVGKFELKSDNGNIYWKPSDATAVEALEKSAVKVTPSRDPMLPASKSQYSTYLQDSPCYYVDVGSNTYMLTNVALSSSVYGVEIPGQGWYVSDSDALAYPEMLFSGILSNLYTSSRELLETLLCSMSNLPVALACKISGSEEFFGCKIVDGVVTPCSFAEADRGFIFGDDSGSYVITKDGAKQFNDTSASISDSYYNVWGYGTAISTITTNISASRESGMLVYNPISEKVELSKTVDVVKDSCEFLTEANKWYHFADIPNYSSMTISITSIGATTKMKLSHNEIFLYDSNLSGIANSILSFIEIYRKSSNGATYIKVGATGGDVDCKIELHESTMGSGNAFASLVSGTIAPESSEPAGNINKIIVPYVKYCEGGLGVQDLYVIDIHNSRECKFVSTGTSSPTSYPGKVGLFYLDTTNKKLYVSVGTSSSSDWVILN